MLSRRCLIFTAEQVYFACFEAIFFDEIFFELPFPRFQYFSPKSAELQLRTSVPSFGRNWDRRQQFWDLFTRIVLRYSQRSLTYPGDGHDAIAGVLQFLSIESTKYVLFDHPVEIVWGIPLPFFDIGLSWTMLTGQSRRDVLTTLPMPPTKTRAGFPSWSWMGWVGDTYIAVGPEKLESEKPVIRTYAHHATAKGLWLWCIQGSVLNVPGFLHGLQSSTWNASKEHDVTLDTISQFYPSLTLSTLTAIPDYHILFF